MLKTRDKQTWELVEGPIRIDIGCGNNKKEGCIGVDKFDLEGVDCCIDLTQERLPFADGSVEYIYSSHFIEHLPNAQTFWIEVGRVAKKNAVIEIWCPYGNTNEADINGHLLRWNEVWWQHVAVTHRDHYAKKFLGGRHWHWHEVNYVINKETKQAFDDMGFSLEFALKHLNNACREWGVFFRVEEDTTLEPTIPIRSYSYERSGERFYVSNGDPVNQPNISDGF